MTGMRKWLLILVWGRRNLLGALWAEEVSEMRMLSLKHWSLFVFPAGMIGGEHGSPVPGSRDKLPCVTFAVLGWGKPE